jgi:hypothetical protein
MPEDRASYVSSRIGQLPANQLRGLAMDAAWFNQLQRIVTSAH